MSFHIYKSVTFNR